MPDDFNPEEHCVICTKSSGVNVSVDTEGDDMVRLKTCSCILHISCIIKNMNMNEKILECHCAQFITGLSPTMDGDGDRDDLQKTIETFMKNLKTAAAEGDAEKALILNELNKCGAK